MKILSALVLFSVVACTRSKVPDLPVGPPPGITTRSGQTEFRVTPEGRIEAFLLGPNGNRISFERPDIVSEYSVKAGEKVYSGLKLDIEHVISRRARTSLGEGEQKLIPFKSLPELVTLSMELELDHPDKLPDSAFYRFRLKNTGSRPVALESLSLPEIQFLSPDSGESLWSFFGASIRWAKGEIQKVAPGSSQVGHFGSSSPNGYGGGIPLVAFWSKQGGVAVGLADPRPVELEYSLEFGKDSNADVKTILPTKKKLNPGEVYESPFFFVAAFRGDYYEPLALYSHALRLEGMRFARAGTEPYEPSWCAWGYQNHFTQEQVLGTFPKVKEMGIRWVTLDDGWFNRYGDWQPLHPLFDGDSLRAFTNRVHQGGLKAQLWWMPLAAEDGIGKDENDETRIYHKSDVFLSHPDWLILDESGKPARNVRNTAILCPAIPEVRQYLRQVTRKFIQDWGFDGHKLDVIYTVPPCHNPKHHHASPEEAVTAFPAAYRIILDETARLKKDHVTQICPCGTPPLHALLPMMNQAVTADPSDSKQVRQRIKMYRALLGDEVPIYGDHVELTEKNDRGEDFASTVGLGGVPGTKFVWPDRPELAPVIKPVLLTPKREEQWKRWLSIYHELQLSHGHFLNLYSYGIDSPEGYAISSGGKIYYAFFSDGAGFKGRLELRGLKTAERGYRARDYENNRELGKISPDGHLDVEFKNHLLIEVRPSVP